MREFGTRTSFRPRPLDVNRQLPIVRDLSELDSTEGLVSREITHNHEALDKENEEVRLECFCQRNTRQNPNHFYHSLILLIDMHVNAMKCSSACTYIHV